MKVFEADISIPFMLISIGEQDLPQVIRICSPLSLVYLLIVGHDGKTLYSSDDRHTSFEFFPSTKKSKYELPSHFWWFFLATCSLLVGTISLLPWISRISRWRMSTFVFSVPSSNSPKWRNPCLPPKRLLMMTCMPSILHSWHYRNVNLIHHELASFTPSTSNTLFLNTDSLRMI